MTAARKKAVQVVTDTHAYVELVPDEDDFLSYWTNRPGAAVETKRILGVDVPVPHDIPLRFMSDIEALKDSTDLDDVKNLLAQLFGGNPLDVWIENGATGEQLQVILAWGMSNAQGVPMDFAEAADLVAKARARDAEGKALAPLNRAGRRASSRTHASARTGR